MKLDYAFWDQQPEYELTVAACLCCDVEPHRWAPADIPAKVLAMAKRIQVEIEPSRDTSETFYFPSYGSNVPIPIDRPGEQFYSREDLRQWSEMTGQRGAMPFLFPEDRAQAEHDKATRFSTKTEDRPDTPDHPDTSQGTPVDPRELVIAVRVDDEMIDVSHRRDGWTKEYSRKGLLGKATKTWPLLVLFARYNNAVPNQLPPYEKQINTSANRRNLCQQLQKSLRLIESPQIPDNSSALRFDGIHAQRDGPDAMSRKKQSLDDEATSFLARHGYDEPVID